MSTPPNKTPARPWIPARPPAKPRLYVLPAAPQQSPAGVLRAGWWLCFLSGGIVAGLQVAGLLTLHAADPGQSLDTAGSISMGLFAAAWYAAYVLLYAGGLAHLVLSIMAMARGAVGRGILLLLIGPLLAIVLALLPAFAGYHTLTAR